MNFKKVIIPLSIIFCISAAHAKPEQFYKPYKSIEPVENIQPKKYLIKTVNVNLLSKIDAPDYLNQEQIKARYIQKLNEELKAKNLLADDQTLKPITVDFDITQKRIFMGEGLKFISSKVVGNYGNSTIEYTSTLNSGSTELAKLSVGERVSIGKKGSVGKIFRDLSGNGKPENELEDIDGFAHFMITQLPE